MSQLRYLIIPLLASLLSFTMQAQAGTITWTGGTTDWNTGSNWSGAAVPLSTDDVVIALDGATVTLPSGIAITVNSLTLGGGTGAIETLRNGNQSANGFRLTVTGNVTVASDGHLDIRGTGTSYVSDSLKVDGTLTNNGLLTMKLGNTITGTVTNNDSMNVGHGAAITGSVTNAIGADLIVTSIGSGPTAELSVDGTITNHGYLELISHPFGAYTIISVTNGSLTNSADGTIRGATGCIRPLRLFAFKRTLSMKAPSNPILELLSTVRATATAAPSGLTRGRPAPTSPGRAGSLLRAAPPSPTRAW